jgi:hypothetical protein
MRARRPAEVACAISIDQRGNHSLDVRGGSERKCGASISKRILARFMLPKDMAADMRECRVIDNPRA